MAKSFYFNDFTGIADGTNLSSLSGWSGGTQWRVLSEQLAVQNRGNFDTKPAQLNSYDTGSTNHVFRTRLKSATNSGTNLIFALASSSTTNSFFVACVIDGVGVNNAIEIQKNVGGSVSTIAGLNTTVTPLGRLIRPEDLIEIRVFGQRAHIYVNSLRVSPDAGYDLDTGGAFTKGTLVGYGTFAAFDIVLDDVYIAQLAGHLTVDATPVFWAGLVGSGRTVPFTGTYSGTITGLEYRVVNASTLAEVQTWAALGSPSIAAGVWSGNATLPLASISANPKFRIEFRDTVDTDVTALTNATTVGLAVAAYGQSNSAFRINPGTASYDSENTYTFNNDYGNEWENLTGADARAANILPKVISDEIDIPCGYLVFGVASRSIGALITSGTESAENYDELVAIVSLANLEDYIQAWVWTQGESEASGVGLPDETDYRAKFDTLLGLLRGMSASPTAPVAVAIIGRDFTVTSIDANYSRMRQILMGLVNKPNVSIAHSFMDLELIDDIHYTPTSYKEANRRTALSFLQVLGYGGYNGRGAIVTSVSRSGAVVTLSVNLNGAASLSGTSLTGYQVSTDDFATTETISSVNVSGNTIVITLSADPGANVKVRSYYGKTPDISSMALSVYADSSTIPVEPIYTAIAESVVVESSFGEAQRARLFRIRRI